MNVLKNFWEFLTASNHYLHVIGGLIILLIGLLFCTPIGCLYATCIGAGCLEFKDYLYSKSFDWIDFVCTVGLPTVIVLILLII